VLANLAWTQGDLDGCEAQAHEGLLLATTASQTRAALLVALTSVQANRGQLALAVNGLQEARSILKELGLKPACAVVLANLAEVQLGLGELQAAWERAAEALAVAGECGHKMAESAAHRVRGMILATVGVHQEAQVELVVALELARELKANHEICGSAFFLARIAVEEGQFEEAEKWIQTGMALVAAGDPERYGAALSVEQALVLALNGKQQEAIALLIKDVPDRLPALRRAEVLLDMARCHAALGISERALALAREAQGLARLRNFQGLMPEILAFISWFSTNIREKEAAMRELSESFAAISGSLPTSWVISLKNRLGLQ
jgi:ATP/maltotriose-dependent transcriptional regulator MalT